MKTALLKVVTVACLLVGAAQAFAATTIRLVYGDSWSRAGRAVKEMLASEAFRQAAGDDYVVELCEESGGKMHEKNLGSLKLPAIFVISEGGNCFYVLENVGKSTTPKALLTKIRKVDTIRKQAEAKGWETPEACGEFLKKMEKYVGGPRRVIAKGFYPQVFEKLKKEDPTDATGWTRHFTMGDGLNLVNQATGFREKKDFVGGEAFLKKIQKEEPTNRLTLEQKQALMMARFALYREDASKKDEMVALLKKVAEAGETTFWGTAAVGWLNLMKEPPLSVYWGWRKGDFKGADFDARIKYGVDCSFPKSGTYTVTFTTDAKAGATPAIEQVALYEKGKKNAVLILKDPKVDGKTTTFTFKLPSKYRGRIVQMKVSGKADAAGESFGKIQIVRSVLRPRPAVKPEVSAATFKTQDAPLVARYILDQVGDDCIDTIARKAGGADFLKRFFGSTAWMESFAGSGVINGSPWRDGQYKGDAAARIAGDKADMAKALIALDLLVWNDGAWSKSKDFIETKIGRNIATALALNHGGRFDDVKLMQIMECYREWAKDGTLYEDAWNHDVYKWRQVVCFGQNSGLSVENLRWIHDFCNIDAPRYYGVCWQCAYRLHNCFGDSVHGWKYYAPWSHRWNTQELRYRVGGVCGALSKFGSHAAAAHGIRSFTAGQPGHCAYMLWDYPKDMWGISYAVTGHTGPHFSLGGNGFAAAEEQNRYFTHTGRMGAERYRWAGEYAKAMRAAPGNWQAAEDWLLQLKAKKADDAAWEEYAKVLCATFKTAPAQGWMLYWPYVHRLPSREAKIKAIRKGLLSLCEKEQRDDKPPFTTEAPYYNEIALDAIAKMFANDQEALWELFPTMLDGQSQTRTFYRQVINWGAGQLMPKDSNRFLSLVGASSEKTGITLDYRNMIVKASQSEDIAMFKQVFSLMNKLAPNLKPKINPNKTYPTERNGGKLLSPDGMLKISTTSGWDSPVSYQSVLEAEDFHGGNGFHTNGEVAPYAMVILPGASDIKAITVVNAGGGYNATRQTPICFWVSENGKEWQEVFRSDKTQGEWNCDLPQPIKAKYIKAGRDPNAKKKEVFHLHKVLIYGTKLY